MSNIFPNLCWQLLKFPDGPLRLIHFATCGFPILDVLLESSPGWGLGGWVGFGGVELGSGRVSCDTCLYVSMMGAFFAAPRVVML